MSHPNLSKILLLLNLVELLFHILYSEIRLCQRICQELISWRWEKWWWAVLQCVFFSWRWLQCLPKHQVTADMFLLEASYVLLISVLWILHPLLLIISCGCKVISWKDKNTVFSMNDLPSFFCQQSKCELISKLSLFFLLLFFLSVPKFLDCYALKSSSINPLIFLPVKIYLILWVRYISPQRKERPCLLIFVTKPVVFVKSIWICKEISGN